VRVHSSVQQELTGERPNAPVCLLKVLTDLYAKLVFQQTIEAREATSEDAAGVHGVEDARE
jgi:hypothetical protein